MAANGRRRPSFDHLWTSEARLAHCYLAWLVAGLTDALELIKGIADEKEGVGYAHPKPTEPLNLTCPFATQKHVCSCFLVSAAWPRCILIWRCRDSLIGFLSTRIVKEQAGCDSKDVSCRSRSCFASYSLRSHSQPLVLSALSGLSVLCSSSEDLSAHSHKLLLFMLPAWLAAVRVCCKVCTHGTPGACNSFDGTDAITSAHVPVPGASMPS